MIITETRKMLAKWLLHLNRSWQTRRKVVKLAVMIRMDRMIMVRNKVTM